MRSQVVVLATSSEPSPGQGPRSAADFAQTAAYAAAPPERRRRVRRAARVSPRRWGRRTPALRVLEYVGGSVPDVAGCIAFVKSCKVQGGGFAQTPGGKPDVVTTAIGLMAAAELKIADQGDDRRRDRLSSAPTPRRSRRSGCRSPGLEAVEASLARLPALGRADREPAPARRHVRRRARPGRSPPAGAAAAILRMGTEPGEARRGHRRDQGRPAARRRPGRRTTGPSDLASTYRVMRAFYMLKEKPDVERLRRASSRRCRQADGGYADHARRQPASLGATYYAAIILRWLRLLDGRAARRSRRPAFAPCSTARTWPAGRATRRSGRPATACSSASRPASSTTSSWPRPAAYGDFILSLSFRLVDGKGNSGVQFRSVRVPGHRDVGLPGRHRRGLLGLPVRRVAAQQGAGEGVARRRSRR